MVLSDFTYDVEGGQLVLCGLAKDRGEALASEPSLVIPDSFDVGGDVALDVSVLGDGLFADFTNLVSVDLPGRLSVIGGQCFSGCSSLAQVSIPVSVVSVGNWAFGGCADDLAVTFLGAYPTEMDDNAFGYGTTVCFDDAQAGWEDAISSVEYCDVRYVRSYALANGQSSEMTLDGVPCVVKWYLDQAGTGAVIYGISLKESDEPTSVKKLELPSALGGKPLVEVDYCALQGLPVSESIVVPATVKAIRPFGVSCDYYPSGYPTGLMVYFMADMPAFSGTCFCYDSRVRVLPRGAGWSAYVGEYDYESSFHGSRVVEYFYNQNAPRIVRADSVSRHDFSESVRLVLAPASVVSGLNYRYELGDETPDGTSPLFPGEGITLGDTAIVRVVGFGADGVRETETAREAFVRVVSTAPTWSAGGKEGVFAYSLEDGTAFQFTNATAWNITDSEAYIGSDSLCAAPEKEDGYVTLTGEIPAPGILTFAYKMTGEESTGSIYVNGCSLALKNTAGEWKLCTLCVSGEGTVWLDLNAQLSEGGGIFLDGFAFQTIAVSPSTEAELLFPRQGGSQDFPFASDYNFVLSSSQDWLVLEASPAGGYTITASENTGGIRYAQIVARYKEIEVSYSVRQYPGPADGSKFTITPLDEGNPAAGVCLSAYTGYDSILVIPEKVTYNETECQVTAISNLNYRWFREVTLPESITQIGDSAFANCSNLTTVNIPARVEHIGNSAFYGCSSLEELTLPANLTTFGSSVFYCASALKKVFFDGPNPSLDNYSIRNGNVELYVWSHLEGWENRIGTTAGGCKTVIDRWSLGEYNGDFATLTKDGVVYLTGYRGDESIVTLPDTVTVIAPTAFLDNKTVTELNIPPCYTEILGDAFDGMDNLQAVRFDGEFPQVDGEPFNGAVTLYGYRWVPGWEELFGHTVAGCGSVQERFYYESAPTFSRGDRQAGSAFSGELALSIACGELRDGDTLRYVVDGVLDGNASPYTDPLDLTSSASVQAAVFDAEGRQVSPATSVNYTRTGAGAGWEIRDAGHLAYWDSENPSEMVFFHDGWGIQAKGAASQGGSAVSAQVTSTDASSAMTLELEGPGVLSFLWRSSCREECSLGFSVDGVLQESISGESGWRRAGCILSDDRHTLSWCYSKERNSSAYAVDTTENRGYLDCLVFSPGAMTVQISPESRLLKCEGAERNLVVSSDGGEYRLTSVAPWLGLMAGAEEGAYTLEAAVNPLADPREGAVLLSRGRAVLPLVFTQSAQSVAEKYFVWRLDDEASEATLVQYCGFNPDVVIPAAITRNEQTYQVTAIGENAFQNDDLVTSVEIPASVRSVGDVAFAECPQLRRVIFLGEGDCVFGKKVFYDCDALSQVVLPAGTSAIGASAFESCGALKRLVMPAQVTAIGDGAFYSCTALREIQLSETLASIGDNAFGRCSRLTALELPDFLQTIGSQAFERCTSLKSLEIPALVTAVPYSMCGYCTALTEISLSEALVEIDASAFEGCSLLESVAIPATVIRIENNAFYGCKALETASFAEGSLLENLGGNAFYNCSALESLHLLNALQTLGDSAFANCVALREMQLPEGVTKLGNRCFAGCKALGRVLVEGTKPEAGTTSYNYSFPTNAVLYVHPEKSGWAEILASQTKTFSGASVVPYYQPVLPEELKSLVLQPGAGNSAVIDFVSNGVATIGVRTSSWLNATIDGYAVTITADVNDTGADRVGEVVLVIQGEEFVLTTVTQRYVDEFTYSYNDGALTATVTGYAGEEQTLVIPATTVKGGTTYAVTAIAESAFSEDPVICVVIPNGIQRVGAMAFRNCALLEEARFGGVLDSIGNNAFDACVKLTSIQCAAKEIGQRAFYGCKTLSAVVLEEGTETIGQEAFTGSSTMAIESLTLPTSLRTIGNSAFCGNSSLTACVFPEGLKSIGDCAFKNCGALTAVVLPASIDSLGTELFSGCTRLLSADLSEIAISQLPENSFYNCVKLVDVQLPSTLVTIGDCAFCLCTKLQAIGLPEGLKQIGDDAFKNTTVLAELALPSTLEAVGKRAFIYSGLTSLAVPAKLTTWGEDAFAYSSKLQALTVAEGVTTIGEGAFYYCSALTDVQLPNTLIALGEECFANSGLTEIAIPANVTSIPAYAFEHCSQLRVVGMHEDVLSIGDYAFNGCSALEAIALEDVTVIGESAFNGCESLASVEFAPTLVSIGTYAFSNTALTEIALPATLTSASGAFKNCTTLRKVRFAYGIPTISSDCFYGCSALADVVISATVTKISANAFKNCSALEFILFDGPMPQFQDQVFDNVTTVQAFASRDGYGWEVGTSPAGCKTVIERLLDTPSISRVDGVESTTFRNAVQIRIEAEQEDAEKGEIRYELNGEVTSESQIYTAPFTLEWTTTVRAAIFAEGQRISNVAVATYEMNLGDVWSYDGEETFTYESVDGNTYCLNNLVADKRWTLQNEVTYNASSCLAASNAGAKLSMEVEGQGILSFAWYTAEEYYNMPRLAVTVDEDEAVVFNATAEKSWQRVSVPITTAGEHTVTWELLNETEMVCLDAIAWNQASVTLVEGDLQLDGSAGNRTLHLQASHPWSVEILGENTSWLTLESPLETTEGEGEVLLAVQVNRTSGVRRAVLRVVLHDALFGDVPVFQEMEISQSPIELPFGVAVEPAGAAVVTWNGVAITELVQAPIYSWITVKVIPAEGYAVSKWDGDSRNSLEFAFQVRDDSENAEINMHTLTLQESVDLILSKPEGCRGVSISGFEAPYVFAPGAVITLNADVFDGYRLTGWSLDGEPLQLSSGNSLTVTREMSGKELSPVVEKVMEVTVKCLYVDEEGALKAIVNGDALASQEGAGVVSAESGRTRLSLTTRSGYLLRGWNLAESLEGVVTSKEYDLVFDWQKSHRVTVYAILDMTTVLKIANDDSTRGSYAVFVDDRELSLASHDFAHGVELALGSRVAIQALPKQGNRLRQWRYAQGADQSSYVTSIANPLELTLKSGMNAVALFYEPVAGFSLELRSEIPAGAVIAAFENGNKLFEGAGTGVASLDSVIAFKAVVPPRYVVRWYRGVESLAQGSEITASLDSNALKNAFAVEFVPTYLVQTAVEPVVAGECSFVSREFPLGSDAQVALTEKPYWELERWSDGESLELTRTIASPQEPCTIQLTAYMKHYVQINCVIAGDGNGAKFTGAGRAYIGSGSEPYDVEVTVIPTKGYRFVCWNDGGVDSADAENPVRKVRVSHDLNEVTLQAKVVKQHKVTVGMAEGSQEFGTVDGALEGATVDHGTQVTFCALAAEGAKFIQWSDGSTEAKRTLTITEDTTYLATFRSRKQRVSVSAEIGQESRGQAGVVTKQGLLSNGELEVGKWYAIAAIPAPYHRFQRWSDGSTTAERSVRLGDDGLELTASFVQQGALTVILTTDPAEYPAAVGDPQMAWSVDGGELHASGEQVMLDTGRHAVTFSATDVWGNQGTERVNVKAGENLEIQHEFTLITTGSVDGIVTPQSITTPVWRILPDDSFEGTDWLKTNTRVKNVPQGDHVVSFDDVQGWIKPADRTITVTAGKVVSFSDSYTEIVPGVELLLDPMDVSEGAGTNAVVGTLQRVEYPDNPVNLKKSLTVILEASEKNRVLFPAKSVTIPAGKMSVQFPIGVVDNAIVEDFIEMGEGGDSIGRGTSVRITGTVQMSAGCNCSGKTITFADEPIEAVLNILDDDSPALAVVANKSTLSESAEPFANALTIRRNEEAPGAAVEVLLSVLINSVQDDGTEMELWKEGQPLPKNADGCYLVTIPAGEASVDVDVLVKLDQVEEAGIQMVSVYADSATAEYTSGSAWMMINDQSFPDYTVSEVLAPVALVSETEHTLHFTVTNAGNVPIPKGVSCEVTVAIGTNCQFEEDSLQLPVEDVTAGQVGDNFSFVFEEEVPVGGSYHVELLLGKVERAPGDGWRLGVKVNPSNALRELNTLNNECWSAPFHIGCGYLSKLDALPVKCSILPDGSLRLAGKTLLEEDTELPAPNRKVELFAVLNGIRMVLDDQIVSDENGDFEFIYDAASRACVGHVGVGACYPGEEDGTIQCAFDVLGMSCPGNYASRYMKWDFTAGVPREVTLTLVNPNILPHGELAFQMVDARDDVRVETIAQENTVPANSRMEITLRITVDTATSGKLYERCAIRVSASDGVSLDVPVFFYAYPQHANLVFDPATLDSTMTMGETTDVEVTLFNNGVRETGPISVSLPSNCAWMSCVGGTDLASIPAGESATMLLRLKACAETPLGNPITGSIAFNADSFSTPGMLPFTFTATAEGSGKAIIQTVDEAFFYEDPPKALAETEVTISNPYTGVVYAKGLTDASGYFEAEDLPVGKLLVTAYKSQHNQVRDYITIAPGRTASSQLFLQFQAISYKWEVERTEIEDHYEVVLHTVYSVQVPVPVVKLDTITDYTDMVDDEVRLVNLTFTNLGLIRANDVTFKVEETSNFIFETLVPDGGFTLDPGQVMVFPMKVTKLGPQSRAGGECQVPALMAYSYPCGGMNQSVGEGMAMTLDNAASCGGDGDGDKATEYETVSPGVGGNDGPGGPGSGTAASGSEPSAGICAALDAAGSSRDPDEPSSPSSPLSEDPDACDGNLGHPEAALRNCLLGSAGCPGAVLGSVLNASNLSWSDKAIAIASCIKNSAVNKTASALGIFSCLDGVGKSLGLCKKSSNGTGSGDSRGDDDEKDDSWKDRSKLSAEALAFLEDVELYQGFVRSNYDAMRIAFGEALEDSSAESLVMNAPMGQLVSFMKAFSLLQIADPETGRILPIAEDAPGLFASMPENFTDEDVVAFIRFQNRTADYLYERGITTDSLDPLDYPDMDADDHDEPIMNYRAYMTVMETAKSSLDNMVLRAGSDEVSLVVFLQDSLAVYQQSVSQNSVCASVALDIKQKISMTREAFDGTLTMTNGHPTEPIQALGLIPLVTDEEGNDCTELFEIFEVTEEAAGITSLDGNGVLAANSTGSAVLRFIPENGAAPENPKAYNFGGRLTYINPFNGNVASIQLTPCTLTVNPSPKLQMHYFLQRDVISDDPLTKDVVEPAEPAELSALVYNAGYGVAKNFRIDSGQPEIVDNEKGLAIDISLWDYDTKKSLLNGQPNNAPLGQVCLGDIGARASATAQWWLTASILGHFTEMSATYTHLDSHGNPNISLIDSVEMHPLIHSGRNLDGDEVVWLTTENRNAFQEINGTLYFQKDAHAEYTSASARLASEPEMETRPDGTTQMRFRIQSTLRNWYYVNFPLERIADYQVVSFRRRLVGELDEEELSVENIWSSFCTLEDNSDPIYEDKLHFIDLLEQDEEYEYTVTMTASPEAKLQVVEFSGMSLNDEVVPDSLVTAPVDQLKVRFSEPIRSDSFTFEDLALRVGAESVDAERLSQATIVKDSGDPTGCTYVIGNLAELTNASAYHVLTVQCAGIANMNGFAGKGGYLVSWTHASAEGNEYRPYFTGMAISSTDIVRFGGRHVVIYFSAFLDTANMQEWLKDFTLEILAEDDSSQVINLGEYAELHPQDGIAIYSQGRNGVYDLGFGRFEQVNLPNLRFRLTYTPQRAYDAFGSQVILSSGATNTIVWNTIDEDDLLDCIFTGVPICCADERDEVAFELTHAIQPGLTLENLTLCIDGVEVDKSRLVLETAREGCAYKLKGLKALLQDNAELTLTVDFQDHWMEFIQERCSASFENSWSFSFDQIDALEKGWNAFSLPFKRLTFSTIQALSTLTFYTYNPQEKCYVIQDYEEIPLNTPLMAYVEDAPMEVRGEFDATAQPGELPSVQEGPKVVCVKASTPIPQGLRVWQFKGNRFMNVTADTLEPGKVYWILK